MTSEIGFNILIVDDEPDLLEILAVQFKVAGCHTLKAKNGQEALDLIKSQHKEGKFFDAVVSDFNMPQMNGMALLKELRKLDFTVPFIFYTGYGDKEKTLEALRLGALDFLDKPFNPQEMLATVTRAAELGRMMNELDQQFIEIGRQYQVPESKLEKIKNAQKELFRTRALSQKS